jgi:O-antigen/teichoic acid export membrane protein
VAREQATGTSAAQGGSIVAVTTMVMNVCTYGFTMLAAHLVGPRQYGAFVAALNLIIVIQVVALGLQAAAARRIATDPGQVGHVQPAIMRLSWQVSLGVGAVVLALTPVINALLRLESIAMALLVAVASVPLTLVGGMLGVLQGERRWNAVGWIYALGGIPRLTIGLALLAWQPTAMMALLGVTLGYLFPVLAGWWHLRGSRPEGRPTSVGRVGGLVTETAVNGAALLAFFALSSVDIIIARQVLAPHEAGLYAAGLIVVKAMLFLPQFVVVVAFPEMAKDTTQLRTLYVSIAALAGIGTLAALATWLLSGVALVFAGGQDYAEVQDRLWVFALLGTVLSMLQLLVYAALARRGQKSVVLVWLSFAALVVLSPMVDSVDSLVWLVLAVNSALLVLLLAAARWSVGRAARLSV